MAEFSKVLKEVLKSIQPSAEEKRKLNSVARKCMALAKREARKFKAKPIIAGSITRDTWLPGKMEFDVFIQFPPKMTVKQLEKRGLDVGKKIIEKLKGSYKIEYAQHPYVSGKVDDVSIDIVPCFDVKTAEEMKSAVDRTPFHVKYLQKNLPLKLSNEVRLLKQFLTANKIYGADTKTEGFSGYMCELLIINYRNFVKVLKQVEKWRPGEIIDLENFYPKKEHQRLARAFARQSLIIIDPTDKTRNTAAALSAENFFKFKKLASEFLSKPRKEMFFAGQPEMMTENELINNLLQRKTELILVKFNPPDVVPDVLWPQLRRFAERMQNILEEMKYEFRVLRRDCYTNEKDLAVVLLEMEVSSLPAVQKKVGPEVFDADDSKRFLEKYMGMTINGPFVEGNNWVVEVRRKFMTAREKLADSLRANAVILRAKGIPNHIADQIVKGFELIFDSDGIMGVVKKDREFGVFLKKYFIKESLA